jgi:hypothetical protein
MVYVPQVMVYVFGGPDPPLDDGLRLFAPPPASDLRLLHAPVSERRFWSICAKVQALLTEGSTGEQLRLEDLVLRCVTHRTKAQTPVGI